MQKLISLLPVRKVAVILISAAVIAIAHALGLKVASDALSYQINIFLPVILGYLTPAADKFLGKVEHIVPNDPLITAVGVQINAALAAHPEFAGDLSSLVMTRAAQLLLAAEATPVAAQAVSDGPLGSRVFHPSTATAPLKALSAALALGPKPYGQNPGDMAADGSVVPGAATNTVPAPPDPAPVA